MPDRHRARGKEKPRCVAFARHQGGKVSTMLPTGRAAPVSVSRPSRVRLTVREFPSSVAALKLPDMQHRHNPQPTAQARAPLALAHLVARGVRRRRRLPAMRDPGQPPDLWPRELRDTGPEPAPRFGVLDLLAGPHTLPTVWRCFRARFRSTSRFRYSARLNFSA